MAGAVAPEASGRHSAMAVSGLPAQPPRSAESRAGFPHNETGKRKRGFVKRNYSQVKGASEVKDNDVDRKTELLSVWDLPLQRPWA